MTSILEQHGNPLGSHENIVHFRAIVQSEPKFEDATRDGIVDNFWQEREVFKLNTKGYRGSIDRKWLCGSTD